MKMFYLHDLFLDTSCNIPYKNVKYFQTYLLVLDDQMRVVDTWAPSVWIKVVSSFELWKSSSILSVNSNAKFHLDDK